MEGAWGTSTQGVPYGSTKRYSNKGEGTSRAYWNFTNIPPGKYDVHFWINDNNYASDARYYIIHAGNSQGTLVTASQNYRGNGWQPLGNYDFNDSAEIFITNYWEEAGVYVVADAMRLTKTLQDTKRSLWFIY